MAQRNARTLTDDQLFEDWLRWINRAYNEAVWQAWRYRIFRLMRGVFEQNTEIQETGGFLLKWAADNYVEAAMIAFRRELDTQGGTENLLHVLIEMQQRPEVISRKRFRDTWPRRDFEVWSPDRDFDRYPLVKDANDSERDHIDPSFAAEDLDRLEAQDHVLEHVQATIAHRVPERPSQPIPTYGEFHKAVEVVQGVIEKYYLLLAHKSIWQFEPAIQYDTHEVFTVPWIKDPNSFNYKLTE